jgi:hypothetical protein
LPKAVNRNPAGVLGDGREFDEPMNMWDQEIGRGGNHDWVWTRRRSIESGIGEFGRGTGLRPNGTATPTITVSSPYVNCTLRGRCTNEELSWLFWDEREEISQIHNIILL